MAPLHGQLAAALDRRQSNVSDFQQTAALQAGLAQTAAETAAAAAAGAIVPAVPAPPAPTRR